MQNAENKSKKYVVLATYAIAVICLLAGLFLPLFDGKNLLALQLGDVFKSLGNKENEFSLAYSINLFGIEKLGFDFMALVIVLYLVVTALSLFALVPVILSVLKEGKLAKKFYYGIEIAALIVLSLFFVVALQERSKNYNMVIAIVGTAIALAALCVLDKGKDSAIKIALFALSAIGFLALFDYVLLLGQEEAFEAFTTKLSPALVSDGSGANYLTLLFATKLSEALALLDAKNKILLIVAAITATVVLINFFIDAVKLATGRDRKFGKIFDIARYGLELAGAVVTLILALVCKESVGIMLIVILAAAALKLAIAIVRFISGILKKPDNERVDDAVDEPETDGYNEPLLIDGYSDEDFIDDELTETEELKADDGYLPPSDDDNTEPEDDDGYISPEEDEEQQAAEQQAEEAEAEQTEEPAEEVKPAEEEIEDYEIKTDGTYLLPAEEEAKQTESAEEEAQPEPEEEPIEEAAEEAAPAEEESETVEESAEEIAEEPAAEETEEEKPEDDLEETVQRPYHEEIKPYNPYERHSSNPFRDFEEPPQPYNPYAQRAAEKPEQKPVQAEKPVQPIRPVYEPRREQRPAYKPYEHTERPQNIKPLQPRPIIQEFKPVPPISEQPRRERQVYTIDKIYAGPIDEFIRKLTNDERIEFAMTFIEKSKGELGSIPDYVVGGDNKKFFQLSFIYLGRVRGLVSDGLLNKMYKELNML